jgi:hypothetical protein
MLFRLTDHYQSNEEDKYEENEDQNKHHETECFICYEVSIEDEEKPFKLTSQKKYIKKCTCEGLIHNICLDTWYEKSQKCPVCRNYMYKKLENNEEFYIVIFFLNYRDNFLHFFRIIVKLLLAIFRVLFLLWLFFSTLEKLQKRVKCRENAKAQYNIEYLEEEDCNKITPYKNSSFSENKHILL